jgi:hypothetical protein
LTELIQIGVGRCEIKSKDLSNTLEISLIAGNQNRAQFTARIRKQNVEDETSRCRSKYDALILNQPGESFTQGFPSRRRWIDNPAAFVIRPENGSFQLVKVAGASRAGSQLRGYDGAEVQAWGRPLDKYFQQSRILLASGGGDETVGIQYELKHEKRSIDPRKLQFTECSDTISQLPPKAHQAKRHLDRLTFGGGAQFLLSAPQERGVQPELLSDLSLSELPNSACGSGSRLNRH